MELGGTDGIGRNRWDGMEQAEHYILSRNDKWRYNVISIRKTLLLHDIVAKLLQSMLYFHNGRWRRL